MYGVKVKSVHTSILPSKSRRIRTGIWRKRKLMKKATVTLEKGQTLDPNNPTFKKAKK
jgi:ribosomal protein L23